MIHPLTCVAKPQAKRNPVYIRRALAERVVSRDRPRQQRRHDKFQRRPNLGPSSYRPSNRTLTQSQIVSQLGRSSSKPHKIMPPAPAATTSGSGHGTSVSISAMKGDMADEKCRSKGSTVDMSGQTPPSGSSEQVTGVDLR